MKHLIFLIGIGLILTGCLARHSSNLSASQLEADANSSESSGIDLSASRKSEAMQRFLIAELSMDAGLTDEALDNLRASSLLVTVPEPQIQTNLAELYISKGELKAAINALESVPSSLEVLSQRAAILQTQDKWLNATEAYEQLLIVDPKSGEARLMLALESLQKDKAARSILLLEELIAKDPKNLPGLKLLGFAYQSQKNSEKALSYFEQVRQLDVGDLHTLESILLIALETGKDDLVARELEREKKLNPESPLLSAIIIENLRDPHDPKRQKLINALRTDTRVLPSPTDIRLELARFALIRQSFPEAIFHYSLLLAAAPKDDELRYTLALALSSNGRLTEATSHLEKIERKSPWYVRAQAFAGMLYRQRSDFKSSASSFRSALKADPKSEQLQNYLASVLKDDKKFEEAKKVYQNILKQDPNNQRILFSYGILLSDMNNQKECSEVMQKLIGINPHHAEALNFIAFDLAEQGNNLDRALELANRALQLKPENGFFLDTRAWVYFKMEKLKEAIKDLERAVDLAKGDSEISEHLADVYLKIGRKKEALQTYKDALDNIIDSREPKDKSSAERIKNKIEELSQANANKNH